MNRGPLLVWEDPSEEFFLFFGGKMRPLRILAFAGMVFVVAAAAAEGDADVNDEEVESQEEVPYVTPEIHPKVHFADHFDGSDFEQKWIKSSAKKEGAESGIDQ